MSSRKFTISTLVFFFVLRRSAAFSITREPRGASLVPRQSVSPRQAKLLGDGPIEKKAAKRAKTEAAKKMTKNDKGGKKVETLCTEILNLSPEDRASLLVHLGKQGQPVAAPLSVETPAKKSKGGTTAPKEAKPVAKLNRGSKTALSVKTTAKKSKGGTTATKEAEPVAKLSQGSKTALSAKTPVKKSKGGTTASKEIKQVAKLSQGSKTATAAKRSPSTTKSKKILNA
jgi:hypothetical protein